MKIRNGFVSNSSMQKKQQNLLDNNLIKEDE